MRLTHLLTVPAAAGAIILLGMSSASAGEINGSGNPPGARAWARPTPTPSAASPAWRTATEPAFRRPRWRAAAELGPRPQGRCG